MKPARPTSRHRAPERDHCALCAANGYCFPDGVNASRSLLRQPVAEQQRLAKNDVLFTVNAPFIGIFGLRSGSSKTFVTADNGNTQVVRIDLGGDMLGLEGFAAGIHTTTVVALENSTFCFLPHDRLMHVAQQRPALREKLLGAMARTLVYHQRAVYALAGTTAEQRVAGFLVTTSERLAERGYSDSDLVLNVTRQEIGSLLGLTLETVSRCLSSLEARQLIHVLGRHVELLDQVSLRNLVVRVA
ncbi:Crp/Fnr family transcriptional regulator [Paraburkholderia fungorum]|jgi:CRP/FNR family transcriptional regulator|nr:helix-turn-helix domain-containing protein [Paraburkholderia fungorum]MDT8843270.1 helix-turn-helix domain-containing protein [Paraburkholderia fungorum]